MKQYTAEQTNHTITELTEKLKAINTELLSIYKQKEIFDFIEKGKKEGECKGFQTFSNIIFERYNPKKEKKEVFLDYIDVLYKKLLPKTSFEAPLKGELFYDVFYCRTDGSGNETIGVAKLFIESDWSSAKLMYFYHSADAPFVYLEGIIKKYNKNIYINFDDKTEQRTKEVNPENKADASLVLYTIDENVSKVMIGCLTSINRHKRVPMASLAVLKISTVKSLETTNYLSDFKEVKTGVFKRAVINVDESIKYYLIGQQLRPDNDIGKIISDIDNLSTYEDFTKIEDFVNTYQYIYFSTNTEKKSIRSYKIDILLGGLVKVYANTKAEKFEIGRARIISKETTPILLVQYDFNTVDRSYRKSLLLQYEKGYLEGIYFGIIDSELASGRVILKVNNNYESDGVIFLNKKDPIVELNKLTQNDEYIKDFFQNDSIYTRTDLGLKELLNISKEVPKTNELHNYIGVLEGINGNYECYFNVKTLEDQNNARDSSTFGQILYMVPMKMYKDRIEIIYQGETILGEINFDNKRVLLRFLGGDYYITIAFRPSKQANVIYGIITIISEYNTDNYDSIQSSYLIIERSELITSDFNLLKFKKYSNLEELIKLEKEKKRGVITKLWGHYNRTLLVREQNSKRYDHQFVRWEAYRRTFWNSACFNAMQYDKTKIQKYLDDAFMDLIRAHNHGFGMKYWADKEYGQEGFPTALTEEYEMIVNEYNNPIYFKDDKTRNFLHNRIKFTYSE